MPNYTETLQLIKPTEEEFYNIAVPNANMDALDAYIRELREQNALLREELTNKANISRPVEYELELTMEGIEIMRSAVFSKNAFGLVLVQASFRKPSGVSLNNGDLIACLPEGFRPVRRTSTVASLREEVGTAPFQAIDFDIYDDGTIAYFGENIASSIQCHMIINASFYATE